MPPIDGTSTGTCDWCLARTGAEPEPIEIVRLVTDGEEQSACNDCLEWYDLGVCAFCDVLHEEGMYVEASGDTLCQSCFSDNYSFCGDCDYTIPLDEMYEGLCEDCHSGGGEYVSRPDGLYGYHQGPPLEFIHRDGPRLLAAPHQYYLGIEIELERAVSRWCEVRQEFPYAWGSYDGSLETNGVEVITHPGTLAALNSGTVIDWAKWEVDFHSHIPNQREFITNGIHVHISRTAFLRKNGEPSAAHLYRFMMFIQRHQHPMQYLAGRNESSYCRWNGVADVKTRKAEAKAEANYTERYRPINTNNPRTIEIRMFDGRSDPAFIRRCYQLVAAVAEYTREHTMSSGMDWDTFSHWVRQDKLSYPDLASTLDSAQVTLTKLAKRAVSVWSTKVMAGIKKDKEDAARLIERRNLIEAGECCDCPYCLQDRAESFDGSAGLTH